MQFIEHVIEIFKVKVCHLRGKIALNELFSGAGCKVWDCVGWPAWLVRKRKTFSHLQPSAGWGPACYSRRSPKMAEQNLVAQVCKRQKLWMNGMLFCFHFTIHSLWLHSFFSASRARRRLQLQVESGVYLTCTLKQTILTHSLILASG